MIRKSAQRARAADGQEEEQRMNRKKKALVAISVAVACSFLGTAYAAARRRHGSQRSRRAERIGGTVQPERNQSSRPSRDFRQPRRRGVLWFRPIAKWLVVRAARSPMLTEKCPPLAIAVCL
jgi:hypothetical protein